MMGKLINKKVLVLGLIVLMMMMTACSQSTPDQPKAETPATTETTESTEQPAETENAADEWPNQPINIMVPASAGGATDIFSRTLGEYITEATGAPVVITNMSGLSGYEMVRTQEPNGYNYAMAITGLLISKAQGDLPYGHEAFDPVTSITADRTTGIIVRGDSPYQTLADLFEAIKADPQSITGGISMTGYPYLYMLAIEDMLGSEMYCVDAGNSAERNTALLGEQVDFIISNAAVTKPYLESGDFRYLGIAAPERNEFIPDVPTFEEEGYDLVFPSQGAYVVAPKGTDPEVIKKFNAILSEIFDKDDYREKMMGMNFAVGAGLTVEETQAELDESAKVFEKYTE
ncbi:tripartite tricarboxylate transporter substrate binding protein [Fusibacter paucivorans]|uniref:Tripartite tricarboxylate transporter substrate binding protein n=1 Tax=Fusibacter paucivorans TaxID=76009 RepID=A0ABS5PJR0_9FIRM|nr:tripartite tricarboxylate transporter substrate binding protein [Fusibacter paucivorans]MBS7525390.1 tripartite tricarboxylate transporter substrate binding protein [Fusibacter paucivorans]